jgi:hypothetical protein
MSVVIINSFADTKVDTRVGVSGALLLSTTLPASYAGTATKFWHKYAQSADFASHASGDNNGTATGVVLTDLGASFSNASDRIVVADASSLHPTTAYTFDMWICENSTGTYPRIMDKTSGGTGEGWFVYLDRSTNKLGISKDTIGDPVNADSNVPKNTWTHIAWSYDSTTLRAFVNGVLVWSSVGNYALTSNTNPLYIGNRAGLDRAFVGTIDEVLLNSTCRYTANFTAQRWRTSGTYTTVADGTYTQAWAAINHVVETTGEYGGSVSQIRYRAGETNPPTSAWTTIASPTASNAIAANGRYLQIEYTLAASTDAQHLLTPRLTSITAVGSISPAKVGGFVRLDGGSVVGTHGHIMLTPSPLIEGWWEYSLASSIRITPANVSRTTDEDCNLYVLTGGAYCVDAVVATTPYGSAGTITIASSDTNVATINGSTIESVSTGTATITISDSNAVRTASFLHNASVTVNNVLDQVESGVTGTFRAAATNSIDSRMSSFDPETDFKQFTNSSLLTGDANTVYTRNTNFWLQDIDWSCLSPMNSLGRNHLGGAHRAGTVISPRFIMCINHYKIWDLEKIWFLGTDNVVYERSIVASKKVGIYADGINIALLNADLPAEVSIAKVLPTNVSLRLGRDGLDLPMVWFNQYREACLASIVLGQNGYISCLNRDVNTLAPILSSRLPANKNMIEGDSGGPGFLLCGTTPVLVGIIQTVGGLVAVGFNHTAINTAMAELWAENSQAGTAQQLTDVDISSYPLLTAL